jgi:hypothetical protein
MTHVHVHVYVIFILFLSCTHKFYQLRIIFKAALARPHAGSMYSRTAAGRPRSHGRRLGMPPKMSAWRFGRYSSFLFSPPPTPIQPPRRNGGTSCLHGFSLRMHEVCLALLARKLLSPCCTPTMLRPHDHRKQTTSMLAGYEDSIIYWVPKAQSTGLAHNGPGSPRVTRPPMRPPMHRKGGGGGLLFFRYCCIVLGCRRLEAHRRTLDECVRRTKLKKTAL